ncbi:MAG: hypothetical protein WCA46_14145, partial [Actinocatenispora sp.]
TPPVSTRPLESDERAGDESWPGPEAGPPDAVEVDRRGSSVEPTGDPRVDDAMTRLASLAGLPVIDQVGGYEEIHRALQDTLATVDDA